MRPKALLSAAVLTVLSLPAAALEYGPGWEIVISDPETSGVHANLWSLAERFSATVAEATGVKPAVRFAGQASPGGHKFYMGEAFAGKAGVLPADMEGWSNGIAEKDGNVYLFGRDVPGRMWAKGEWPSYHKMVLPSARAMTRFLRRFAGVRFVMPGENGRAVPKLAKLTVPDGYVDREDPEFDFMAGRAALRRLPEGDVQGERTPLRGHRRSAQLGRRADARRGVLSGRARMRGAAEGLRRRARGPAGAAEGGPSLSEGLEGPPHRAPRRLGLHLRVGSVGERHARGGVLPAAFGQAQAPDALGKAEIEGVTLEELE